MNQLKLNILLATAATAPATALIVAWLADRWLPNSWLMRVSILTIALVIAGVSATLIMARLARSQLLAQRYFARIGQMDDNELMHTLSYCTRELGEGSPWNEPFRQLSDRLVRHGEEVREAEMSRAAIEVRARQSAAEQQRTASILAHLDEPVLAVDEYDELVMANPSAESLFNFNLGETEQRAVSELVRCQDLIELLEETRGRKAASHRTREIALTDELGGQHWYSVTARAIGDDATRGSEGSPRRGIVAVMRDINTQKDVQKRNAEFVSAVSHEMKTPLAGIKAYVELLADGDAEDEKTREEFLEVINSQADRLQRLIDNLLNLARIEAGVVTVSKQSQSLNDLLEEAYQVVHPAAEQRSIELVRDLSPMYLGVLADRDMLLQSAINLLSNAIKYTPEGKRVILRSRLQGNEVHFEVEDQGVGLSEEDQKRVFEKFYRVKKDQKMAGGTGLGLPLARHIIEDVHGGHLTVVSQLGVGSTFGVQLPSAGQMN